MAHRIIPSPPASWPSWEALMAEALAEARDAGRLGEVPVGAVVVSPEGRIVGRGRNSPLSENDPAAHAEIVAMRQAGKTLDNYRLGGCVLAVTLEPCLMCVGAMVHARLAGLVFGASDPRAGAVVSGLDGLELPFHNHRIWQAGGIAENDCAALLADFFKTRRKGGQT